MTLTALAYFGARLSFKAGTESTWALEMTLTNFRSALVGVQARLSPMKWIWQLL